MEAPRRDHVRPERSLIRAISNANVFLLLVPLGFIAYAEKWPDALVASFNLAAIIPLSVHLSAASGAIGNRWGSLIGGLVNATFGNTVELIVGVLAVLRNEPRMAQSIMVGSILSDILLVQGCCFIAGARSTGVLQVNAAIADTLSTLMIITTVALVLPAALCSTLTSRGGSFHVDSMVISFSRATAVVLLGVYIAYLYFQLKTHASIFVDQEQDGQDEADNRIDTEAETQAATCSVDRPSMLKVAAARVILVSSGLIIAKCTTNFMESLDGMAETLGVSKTFVAIIVIPVASNASEMAQVVDASRKQKIDFAIGVIIGSILQIALFVLPMLVIVGWALRQRMDLYFEPSQTYILLLAVVLVNQVLQDKHYTFLHGALLISVYVVVMAAYFT
ncbi:uncharacterized protein UV8b_05920 [Ustilaginoidea virens]|uniref:Vacuolar calcium ion transporter n=1 Tax=Ustilaginoidea virens TaxID=1159556 RepID=A0A8E5MJ41_USTVR|nr:uncharacterized protein UV8b_05920 [Ustilaginoidea virens]QUC21677.1 hypothetical protein UV8b_05920 [Ustilaginoidea virens]